MRKMVTICTIVALILGLLVLPFMTACAKPAPSPVPAPTPTPAITPAPKKISLEDVPSILNISLLLPSRFEQIDAASEGMSNKDLGLGSDCSEVQLYMSEDPFQTIYGFISIFTSRIEGAVFDRQLEDDSQMKNILTEAILAGAKMENIEVTVPSLHITHPDIGDSAILGGGEIESYGFYYGFDTLWFRSNKVYVFLYSTSLSPDKVSLVSIAEEISKRIGRFSQ